MAQQKPTHHVCYDGTDGVEIYIWSQTLQAANSGNNDARSSIITAVNAALKEKNSDLVIEVSAANQMTNIPVTPADECPCPESCAVCEIGNHHHCKKCPRTK